jgi:hypothetical protein
MNYNKWGLIWMLPRWMRTDVKLRCRSATLCELGAMCDGCEVEVRGQDRTRLVAMWCEVWGQNRTR